MVYLERLIECMPIIALAIMLGVPALVATARAQKNEGGG